MIKERRYNEITIVLIRCNSIKEQLNNKRRLENIANIENDPASSSCSGVDVNANIDNNRIKASIRDTRS